LYVASNLNGVQLTTNSSDTEKGHSELEAFKESFVPFVPSW